MSKLFILGSGFSKSISNHMPTIYGLSEYIKENFKKIPGDKKTYKKFIDDPEMLLTYLYQSMPWKTDIESHLDKAAFISINEMITKYIRICEDKTFKEELPQWSYDFVKYLHNNKSIVASLNYDTIVERLARVIEPPDKIGGDQINVSNYYRMPLAPLRGRGNFLWGINWCDTFQLIKLHGSINWYYSGDHNAEGQQVYYTSVKTKSPMKDITDDFGKSSMQDLEPLLIPPVSEKSLFYNTNLVKTLWKNFRTAIENADEIYSIGYSIPKTDLTMRMFLKGFSKEKDKSIYIVDIANGKRAENLILNYKKTFESGNIKTKYLGVKNPVKKMVCDLVK